MSFKYFLLNENKVYLGQRVGDILNAVQDLEENGSSMGTRQMVKNAEGIVNQIRRILHTNWPKDQEENLKRLQKAGVAVARAIEEKDDLEGVITSVKGELEEVSGDLGVPIQQMGKPEKGKEPEAEGEEETMAPPQGEEEAQPGQEQQPMQPQQQMQPGMPMPQQPMQPGMPSLPQTLPGGAPPGGAMA